MKKFFIGLLLSTGVLTIASAETDRDGTFQQRLKAPIQKSITVHQATQQQIEGWSAERKQLTARYDNLAADNERLTARKAAMEKMLAAARLRIAAREKQLAAMSRLAGDIRPALDDIYRHLAEVEGTDLPFLTTERQARLASLGKLLDDPQVPVSEKLRKTLEALLVEVEYGNTVSVYRETISIEDKSILVNVFRLGRIALFFQTLDRQTIGHYDAVLEKWALLPSSMTHELNIAFEIAARQRPATIATLPIGRIVAK